MAECVRGGDGGVGAPIPFRIVLLQHVRIPGESSGCENDALFAANVVGGSIVASAHDADNGAVFDDQLGHRCERNDLNGQILPESVILEGVEEAFPAIACDRRGLTRPGKADNGAARLAPLKANVGEPLAQVNDHGSVGLPCLDSASSAMDIVDGIKLF